MERYAGYAEDLKAKGYITEYIPYDDVYGFAERDLNGIPESEREIVGHLVEVVLGSVLKDDIPEQYNALGQAIKGTRAHIRNYMYSLGKEAYHFYDYNKLQASNISSTLQLISSLQGDVHFSPKTTQEYESLCDEFTENKNHPFQIDAYYKFNNKEKYAFEKKYTKLLEDVLNETFAHYQIK